MNQGSAYSVRLPADLRAALTQAAQEDQRTMHGQMLYLLRLALAQRNAADEQSRHAAFGHRPAPVVPTARAGQAVSAD